MPIEIAPALEPDEWKHRRCGVSIDRVDGETHVVVTDSDGELVSVSGPEEVFALMALANDARPDADPRDFTHADLVLLRHAMASLARSSLKPRARVTRTSTPRWTPH